MQRAALAEDSDGNTRVLFWCPGCSTGHQIVTGIPSGWGWNGDLARPTFTPSVLVQGGSDNVRCHAFVTDGRIQFLLDCSHQLAGQTVDLPDWPPVLDEAGTGS